MEKQGTGSNAPSPNYSPRSRNASHEWTGWNHEWGRIEPRKARKARKIQGGEVEPRMDTNGHEWAGGTTKGWEGTTKSTKDTKGGG